MTEPAPCTAPPNPSWACCRTSDEDMPQLQEQAEKELKEVSEKLKGFQSEGAELQKQLRVVKVNLDWAQVEKQNCERVLHYCKLRQREVKLKHFAQTMMESGIRPRDADWIAFHMRVRRAAELERTFHANKGVEYSSDESEDEREFQKRKKLKTEP